MYIDEVKLKLDHFAGKFIGFFMDIVIVFIGLYINLLLLFLNILKLNNNDDDAFY